MKIRKFLSAVIATAMVLTLTACNGDNTKSNPRDILNSDNSPEKSSSSDKSSGFSIPAIEEIVLQESPASDFEYERTDDGVKLTKYIGSKTEVKIPSVIEGAKVTSIGFGSNDKGEYRGCFENCNAITTVIIPDSVKTIDSHAFYGCSELTKIVIPDSATGIGIEAFSGCSGLQSLTIPESVTTIAQQAFSGCTGLQSLTIPESLEAIGNNVFSECTGLSSLYIPNCIAGIDFQLFDGCTGIKNLTFSDDVEAIGSGIIRDLTGLKSLTIPDGVTYLADYALGDCTATVTFKGKTYSPAQYGDLFEKIKESLKDFVFEYNERAGGYYLKKYTGNDSVVKIPSIVDGKKVVGISGSFDPVSFEVEPNGFYDNANITKVIIPDSVIYISSGPSGAAFDGCTNLTSVTLPDNTETRFDYTSFIGCTNLKEFVISDKSKNFTSVDGVVYSKDMTKLIHCPPGKSGSFTIPDTVTEICGRCDYFHSDERTYGHAFCGCTELTSITIPKSVTKIGGYAFAGCTGLTSMTIPESVTEIHQGTFVNCTGLTSVTIPDSVARMEDHAFFGCTAEITYKGKVYRYNDGDDKGFRTDDYIELFDAINGN